MHEKAVSSIAEIEGNRLVHAIGFWSLGVGNIKMYLLTNFIE